MKKPILVLLTVVALMLVMLARLLVEVLVGGEV
jgi:hypothetical protein